MIKVEGKDVFMELSELVDPARSALLLMLMRHRFDMATAADISAVWRAPLVPEAATG